MGQTAKVLNLGSSGIALITFANRNVIFFWEKPGFVFQHLTYRGISSLTGWLETDRKRWKERKHPRRQGPHILSKG